MNMSLFARQLGAIALLAAPLALADFVVNSTQDLGDLDTGDDVCSIQPAGLGDPQCTLRAAIQQANATAGDDTITFDVTGTITLGSSLPAISTPINITGPGGDGITVDCAGQMMTRTALAYTNAAAGTTYSVADITLQNCTTDDTAGGGAISFAATAPSTLNLSNVTVTASAANAGPGGALLVAAGNTANVTGGTYSDNTADGMGGAIFNAGNLTIDGTTLADNTSGDHGGGLASVLPGAGGSLSIIGGSVVSGNDAGGNNGGGVYISEDISAFVSIIENATLTDNSAANGGGVAIGKGSLDIAASTIDNNSASAAGGGVFLGADGGFGAVVMVNSTVSTNTAANGGGFGAADGNTEPSSVINSTIALNTGNGFDLGDNPQLIIGGDAAGGRFYKNLLADNTAANCATPFNHSGDEVNAGSNVSTDDSCGLTQSTDIENATANLDDLGDYTGTAGATQTHRILAGSDAIDAGSATIGEATDQRGAPTADGDETAPAVRDAGAYEYAGFSAIEFTAASFTEAENNTPGLIGARRFGNLAQAASATVVSVAGMSTATAGDDYDALTAPEGDVSWIAGDGSEQQVELVINDEAAGSGEVEGDETVGLALANVPTGVDVGSVDPATFTITDFEEGEFNIDPLDYQVTEGTDATVTITITRTNGSDGESEVQVSTADGGNTETDDATAGEDYTAVTNQVVSFDDGDTSATVTIAITDDDDFEVNPESFAVTISATGNTGRAVIGDNNTANVTITSDDAAQPGTFSFTSTAATAAESSGTVSFDVERTDGSDCNVDVTYMLVSGTADLGIDFNDANLPPMAATGTLSFDDGDTANQTITINLTDDNENESTESFSIELTEANVVVGDPATCSDTAQATVGDDDTATITLTSDELEQFQFDITPPLAGSESSGLATIIVEPVTDATGSSTITGTDVTVEITTADGTATAPGDYTTTTMQLTWTDGESGPKSITVPVIEDDQAEGDETFQVALSAVTTATTEAVGTNPATVTITDLPGVRIVAQDYVSDDESSAITVMVERFGDASQFAQVEIATQADGGTATEGEDYPALTRTASWAAGESGTREVSFLVTDDNIVEGDETFVVALQNPQNIEIREPSTATLTITDDDTAVRLSAASYSAAEDAGVVTITVERIGVATTAVSVDYATTDGSATAPEHYTAATGTLNWAEGNADPMEFDVALIDNDTPNADRTFTVQLSNAQPADGVTIVEPESATVTIEDDEDLIAFESATASVTEGVAQVTLTVVRSGSGDGAVSIDLATADESALAPGDYTATTATLNWADGETGPMTVNVPITNDEIAEAAETFTATLSNPTGPIEIGTIDTTTVTIADNDQAGFALAETGDGTTLREGGEADTFTIALTSQPVGTVTVTIAPPERVTADPTTLTFTTANWDQPQTVSVQIGNDEVREPNRVLSASITASSAADDNYDGLTSTVTVVITDAGEVETLRGSSGSLGAPMLALLGLAAWRRRRRA